jgi:hypothetical protein
MNSLELEVVTLTSGGGAHVKLNDDGENLGILYLDKRQLEAIIGILTVGSFNKEINFSINNPFSEDELDEDLPDYTY